MSSIDTVWEELFPLEQVVVSPEGVRIDLRQDGLRDLIQSVIGQQAQKAAA